MTNSSLHPSIVSLVSLAANIAANHPGQGLCQLDKLRQYAVTEEQINLVIEIARHIRDEAGQKLDALFDEKFSTTTATVPAPVKALNIPVAAACCTPTPSGKSCC